MKHLIILAGVLLLLGGVACSSGLTEEEVRIIAQEYASDGPKGGTGDPARRVLREKKVRKEKPGHREIRVILARQGSKGDTGDIGLQAPAAKQARRGTRAALCCG